MMVSNFCLTIIESTYMWFFNKNLVRHNGWTKSKTAVLISVDFGVERAAQWLQPSKPSKRFDYPVSKNVSRGGT